MLALLREQPMHPYQMQRLLRLRHKDEILALKRGSLYHAIARLLRAQLIAIHSTGREGKRPERTIYRITPSGLEALLSTLRRMVATPRRESSEFMAALSFLLHLEPQEAVDRLDERVHELKTQTAQLGARLAAASAHVLPIHLIESEYLLAILKAELLWVEGARNQIRRGKLHWDRDAIFREVQASRTAAGERPEKTRTAGTKRRFGKRRKKS